MDHYIGMDVHSASCTLGILSARGKRLKSEVLETRADVLIEYLKSISGDKHLIIEEGTHAAWLHEILSAHVSEVVVIGVPKNKGQKNDKIDAFALAEKLRIGSIETKVHKGLRRVLGAQFEGQSIPKCDERLCARDEQAEGCVSITRKFNRDAGSVFDCPQRRVPSACGRWLRHTIWNWRCS
jgi:hypothetical protein